MVDKYTFDWDGCIEIVGQHPPPAKLREHVIVDEGQDMPRAFYMMLRMITRSMTVFADENQTLTDQNSTNREIRTAAGISSEASLERNFRNTHAIARVSGHFWTGAGAAPVEVRETAEDGDLPVLDEDPVLDGVVRRIATFERANSTQQIGVLVPYSNQVTKLFNRLKSKTTNHPGMYKAGLASDPKKKRDLVDFAEPGVKILSWASAKGLEFDTVFIPELQAYKQWDPTADDFRMRMYVLTSRAKRELYLLYSGEGEPPIIASFPMEALDDWR